jgi:hypothetical protein
MAIVEQPQTHLGPTLNVQTWTSVGWVFTIVTKKPSAPTHMAVSIVNAARDLSETVIYYANAPATKPVLRMAIVRANLITPATVIWGGLAVIARKIVVATITPRVYVMALESVTFARVGRKGNFVNGALLAPTEMQLRLKLGAGCVNATGMAMLRLEFVIRKPASVTARTTPKDLSVKCAIGNITVIQKVVGNVTSNVNLAEY